jgi:uncharacterized protein
MKETITNLLLEIEKENSIQILYACEVGSRAWDLHHNESDYDVRFVFVRPLREYVSLELPNEVIDIQDSMIDCTGWDLKKTLLLMNKHNPSLLEWLHSPIVYINQSHFKEELINLHKKYFHPVPVLHHYISMARKNVAALEKKMSVKLLVNIVRPILICKWILKEDVFPHLLLNLLVKDLQVKELREVMQLVVDIKKREKPESWLSTNNLDYLVHWINKELSYLDKKVANVSSSNERASFKDELNTYYQKFLLSGI